MTEKEKMIEKMKTITMPLQMLRVEEPELYRELHEAKYMDSWQRWSDTNKGWVKESSLRPSIFVYRLSPDFKLPEPEKVGGWKEFDVKDIAGRQFVDLIGVKNDLPHQLWLSEALHYAIDRGMCPQFWFEGLDTWIYMPHFHKEDGVPRKLLKMRVWEEGK